MIYGAFTVVTFDETLCTNLEPVTTFSAFRILILLLPTNAEEYGNDLITELCGVCPTVFLCTLEVSAMQSVYDDFQLLRTLLIGRTPFAMTSFLQMAAYPNYGRAGIVAHLGSAAGLSGTMLGGTIWNG